MAPQFRAATRILLRLLELRNSLETGKPYRLSHPLPPNRGRQKGVGILRVKKSLLKKVSEKNLFTGITSRGKILDIEKRHPAKLRVL